VNPSAMSGLELVQAMVTGCAVHTMLDAGVGYGTVDLNVKMLKALPLDRELTAEVSEGSLRGEAGALFAHAPATCAIIRT
jgi:acyl-coenzyme A thioesterase PaaI-like protein